MPEAAVATPAGPGSGEGASHSDSESRAGALGFESQGALLGAMGLPDLAAKADGEAGVKKEDAGGGDKPAAPPAQGYTFEFAGRQYHGATEAEARAKAEHAFKVHQGQAAAASKREAQLRKEIAQREQRARVAPAAPAPATVKEATPAKPTGAKPSDGGDGEDGNLLGLTDSDWQYIQGLRREGHHDKADAYLLVKQEDALKRIQGKTKAEIEEAKRAIKDELESIRKPAQEREQQEQLLAKATDSLRNRAELVNDTGDPVYPELQNDSDLAEVVDTWERMCSPVGDYPALPPDIATHPAGFHLAYAVWFHETWGDFIRQIQSEGYTPKTPTAAAADTPPAPPKLIAQPGRLTAPVVMPRSAPRREPTPRSSAETFKSVLTSGEDNLI